MSFVLPDSRSLGPTDEQIFPSSLGRKESVRMLLLFVRVDKPRASDLLFRIKSRGKIYKRGVGVVYFSLFERIKRKVW